MNKLKEVATQNAKEENIFGEVVSGYSRAQAVEDGFLCDISELAKEAGFKFPVAIS